MAEKGWSMNMGAIGHVMAVLVFGLAGWLGVSRRVESTTWRVWTSLLAVALNWVIVSLCVGGGLGLLCRDLNMRRLQRS